MVKGKTKRKLVIILSVFLLALLVILIIIYHINRLYFLPVEQQSAVYYEEGWNMKFPTDMEVVYTTHGELGFQGDGIRYCVFRCNDGTDDFFKDFNKDKSNWFEEEFRSLTIGTDGSENDTALVSLMMQGPCIFSSSVEKFEPSELLQLVEKLLLHP